MSATRRLMSAAACQKFRLNLAIMFTKLKTSAEIQATAIVSALLIYMILEIIKIFQ
jgi:hypothetical protein